MSRTQRLALLGGAVVVLLAVILLTRGGDDKTAAPQAAATTVRPVPGTTVQTVPAPPTTTTSKPKAKPARGPLLTAANPVTVKSKVGRTIRFRARSATDEEVHVHGYDRSVEAPAGKTVSLSLEATMPGIFEIELEHSGTLIGRLEVQE